MPKPLKSLAFGGFLFPGWFGKPCWCADRRQADPGGRLAAAAAARAAGAPGRHKGRLLTQLAVRFALLTFVRSSEMRMMRWAEVALAKGSRTIPAEREEIEGAKHSHRGAKMRTPHLVPLSTQAQAVLQEIHQLTGQFDLVFAGDHDPKKPMSENTVNVVLRRMGYDTKTEICGHGFRTMACSALNEFGRWSKDTIERKMSHQERNGVRAAYVHKAEYIAGRREMMQWWEDYLSFLQKSWFVDPADFRYA